MRLKRLIKLLERLLKKTGTHEGCYITAYNPESKVTSDQQNISANKSLYAEIQKKNAVFYEGIGLDPNSEWEGEPSFLVLGITFDEAKIIGKKFKQNAIVYFDRTCIPELILLK